MNPTSSCPPYFPEFLDFAEAAATEGQQGLAHWKLAIALLDGRYGEINYHKAGHHLLQATKLGCHLAPYYLAELIRSEHLSAVEFGDASEHWQKGAVMGHARAQYQWGLYLGARPHLPMNLAMSYHWLQPSAWNGFKEAEGTLAILLATGSMPNLVLAESLIYLETLIAAGDALASIARTYFSDQVRSIPYGPERERQLLFASARAGVPNAVFSVIHHDLSLEGDNIKIEEHFQKLLEQKVGPALFILAQRYIKSSHPSPSQISEAKELLKASWVAGYWPAGIELADLLAKAKAYSEAMAILDSLAELGLTDAVAFDRAYIAELSVRAGQSYTPDRLHKIQTAAYRHNGFLCSLAFAYSNQEGGVHKPDLELFYLLASMQEGIYEAARLLALNLMTRCLAKYEGIGRCLMTFAAENGDADACHYLGDLYSITSDRIHHPTLAYHWYLKAAEMGYHESIRRVIYCLVYNYGVEGDDAQISAWGRRLRELDIKAGCSSSEGPTQESASSKEGKLIPFPITSKAAGI